MRVSLSTVSNLAFTVACIVVAAVGGLQLWDRFTASRMQEPSAIADVSVDLSLADAPIQGDVNAKLVIIEFSDFQCPYCAAYVKSTYPELKREYVLPGKIKYAFVNFPLGRHEFAQGAAEAAECAHAQGRFWSMHERLFASPDLLGPGDLVGHAEEIGLDTRGFKSCMGGTRRSAVSDDLSLAKRMGVQNTPTFLIGVLKANGSLQVKKKIVGAQPIAVFRQALADVASE